MALVSRSSYDLCHRKTVGKHSRHIERELKQGGKVKLKLIPTKEMSADMFTKALDDETFKRHRTTVMNGTATERMA